MKLQKCGFATILILAVLLLPFPVSSLGAGQPTAAQTQLIEMMKVDRNLESRVQARDARERMKSSLAQQVTADFDAMKVLFQAQDFSSLAKLLEKRGATITTPGFQKIWGGPSAEFWKSVWKKEAEFKLVPISIQVSGALTPQPVPLGTLVELGSPLRDETGNPISYDAVAIVIFEFHIVSPTGSPASHNDTGLGIAVYLHRTVCPWG